MKPHYELIKAQGLKNPYANQLLQQITLQLDKETVAYFKSLAEEMGIPYQSLINLYLRDCAQNRKKLRIKWSA